MTTRDISNDIAILSLTGRFPGAATVSELWMNLCAGHNAATEISNEDIQKAGISEHYFEDPAYVKVGNFIEGEDLFDPAFFDMAPREAELVDPQQRLFLECSWEALAAAGYDPGRFDGRVGVFASVSHNQYFEAVLAAADDPILGFEARISNDKDFISTRVGYKLGLRGPCVTIQTACSSSLVAAHLACQSLLTGESDMVLTGGSSVRVPQRTGYLHQDGFILSADGQCRAFDASADGCNGGNGVGVLLLKRLQDALEDEDDILAVIRSSAINNDGQAKVGFTAPSVEGQAEVISEALALAEIDPETISYIEAHGTGTELGDPIEVAALTKVFRSTSRKKGFCYLGSIKTNIGHLDAAAGAVGLMKAALVLREGVIPPSPYFSEPNPELDLDASPFVVSREKVDLPPISQPRRAAVSAFGIGGTNAHMILEEAPRRGSSDAPRRRESLLLLSARSEKALEESTDQLAAYLESAPETALADVAYTLAVGRPRFEVRRCLTVGSSQEAIQLLRDRDPQRVATVRDEGNGVSVAFLFPGGGAQYLGMGQGLYKSEEIFRKEVDACCELLLEQSGYDPRTLFFGSAERHEDVSEQLERTSLALPALFVVEYSLAQLFMSLGVQPRAVMGHSLGEYVAACLAGVFSLEDALRLVTERGRLFEELPEGAMISVPLSEAQLREKLGADLSIAAVNGDGMAVASGTVQAIEVLSRRLAAEGIEGRRLHIAVAAHSHLVEPILESFGRFVETIELHPPRIPLLSNVLGTWAGASDLTDPSYWVRHLRQTVRFGDGLAALLRETQQVILEVGPGRTLSNFATAATFRSPRTRVLTSLRHPKDQQSDEAFFHETVGRLWLYGVDVDWKAHFGTEKRHRVRLPTYPFQRQSLLIKATLDRGAKSSGSSALQRKKSVRDWVCLPAWRRSAPVLPGSASAKDSAPVTTWLLSVGGNDAEACQRVFARYGRKATVIDPEISLQAWQDSAAFGQWLSQQAEECQGSLQVVSFLSAGESAFYRDQAKDLLPALNEELRPLKAWIEALSRLQIPGEVELTLLTRGGTRVLDEEVSLSRWVLAGLLDSVRFEAPDLYCRWVDLPLHGQTGDGTWGTVLRELQKFGIEEPVALRRNQRWVPSYESVMPSVVTRSEVSPVEGGAALILGSGVRARSAARVMAKKGAVRLVIAERERPGRAEEGEQEAAPARFLEGLEVSGVEIETARGDFADPAFFAGLVKRVEDQGTPLRGVIVFPEIDVSPVSFANLELEQIDEVCRPLGAMLLALEAALEGHEPEVCLISSSIVSISSGVGGSLVASMYRFLESFIAAHNREFFQSWTCLLWDSWEEIEEAPSELPSFRRQPVGAIASAEAERALEHVLSLQPQDSLAISPRHIEAWLSDRRGFHGVAEGMGDASEEAHNRPDLTTPYVAPTTELEARVVQVFRELLGISIVGVHDSFFELGGNSLLAAKAVAQVREVFGVAPPLSKIFEQPTPGGLAQLIAASQIAAEATTGAPPDDDRESGEI